MDTSRETSLYGQEVPKPKKKKNGKKKVWEIQKLWQRQHEILGYALSGMKHKDIADIVGCSVGTVRNALNSELGKEKLNQMRERRDEGFISISERVKKLTHKGLDTYERILNGGENASIEMKKEVADTVCLDIGGLRAPERSESIQMHATLEEIEEFKKRGIEAAREMGRLYEIPEETGEIEEGEIDES